MEILVTQEIVCAKANLLPDKQINIIERFWDGFPRFRLLFHILKVYIKKLGLKSFWSYDTSAALVWWRMVLLSSSIFVHLWKMCWLCQSCEFGLMFNFKNLIQLDWWDIYFWWNLFLHIIISLTLFFFLFFFWTLLFAFLIILLNHIHFR